MILTFPVQMIRILNQGRSLRQSLPFPLSLVPNIAPLLDFIFFLKNFRTYEIVEIVRYLEILNNQYHLLMSIR